MRDSSTFVANVAEYGTDDQLKAARKLIALQCREYLHPFVRRTFGTVAPGYKFFDNWHLRAIVHQLERVGRGECRRLIITMPPRSLKSISASVAFPAWLLGRDSTKQIICVSYSQDLADKHARDCRNVILSDWYQQTFPRTALDHRKAGTAEFMTTKRGFRLATSVGGTLTGRGGDIIIIDDPLKPEDAMSEVKRTGVNDWYGGTLLSRLNDKTDGAIIIVTQRLHLEDLVGHVQGNDEWEILNLPAIAEEDEEIVIGPGKSHFRLKGDLLHPARETEQVLRDMKAELGSMRFSAQYQQNPVPSDGDLIKWSWFRKYRERPKRQTGDLFVHSWDTASKDTELADYSVCTIWLVRDDDYYLLEVNREKLLYPNLKKKVMALREHDKPNAILIENRGSGMSLIDDLKASRIRPIEIDPVGDKVTRMSAASAALEAGKVLLPEHAKWLDKFKTELLQFPHGRHDDQVDSLSQALAWIEGRHRRGQRKMLKVVA